MSIPMSRDEMRGMKAKRDEEMRIESIIKSVESIYRSAINVAKTSTNTNYSLDMHKSYYQFYEDNMEEILSGLKDLFPDCTVKLAKMCTGNDGKRYDISTMDEKMLPFINQRQTVECIVVDWS